ncbi:MAG: hypothetical protein R3C03_03260 [Pirellulaceae bacterium]
MNRLLAEKLLLECRGDEVWSIETCQSAGIPQAWIDELQDAFESGFDHDRNTLYIDGRLTNQFGGCRDDDLAYKLAEYLGIDSSSFEHLRAVPEVFVARLQQELDEL